MYVRCRSCLLAISNSMHFQSLLFFLHYKALATEVLWSMGNNVTRKYTLHNPRIFSLVLFECRETLTCAWVVSSYLLIGNCTVCWKDKVYSIPTILNIIFLVLIELFDPGSRIKNCRNTVGTLFARLTYFSGPERTWWRLI